MTNLDGLLLGLAIEETVQIVQAAVGSRLGLLGGGAVGLGQRICLMPVICRRGTLPGGEAAIVMPLRLTFDVEVEGQSSDDVSWSRRSQLSGST